MNDFTTLIYYNLGYNLFTLRQSSRRSWRINQTAPRIEVYFLFYEGTLQERALTLMASKLAAAGLLEGNITDEGLAAMSDCRDLTSQLAKELTKGIRTEVEDLAAVFKRMAILKTDEEKAAFVPKSPPVPDVSLTPEIPEPAYPLPLAETVQENTAPMERKVDSPAEAGEFVFSAARRGRKNQAIELEEQLSFFEISA